MNAILEGDSAADAELSFGLMRVGGKLLALPIEMLREVIPCPAALDPLPVPAPGLCGAVRLRGNIIPVLDLRAVLEPALPSRPAEGRADSVIVLMRCEGRLLGLLVDAVQGMAEVASEQLHAFSCVRPSGSDIVTHTFEVEGGIATVLDAGRIAALPGVPMVAEPSVARRDRAVGQREPMLLFRCGDLPLGIAASSVDATVPRAALRESSLVDRLCRGVVDHHGHEVPVIDTLRVLGIGESVGATESALVVLRFPKGLLALMLDEVRDIVRVGPEDILPLPPLGLKAARLFRGMLGPAPGAEPRDNHLLLDDAALRGEEALAALASLSRPKAQGGASAGSGRSAPGAGASANRAYLTYLVGVETASPLIQSAEILDYPRSGVVELPERRDSTLGLFAHRGAAVPLVCLCSLLGRPVTLDPASARVLIVECGRQRIGFVVQALCSIETASWEQPETTPKSTASMRGMQPLIEIGKGAQRRTLPRLDLLQLARALLGEKSAASSGSAGAAEADREGPSDPAASSEEPALAAVS